MMRVGFLCVVEGIFLELYIQNIDNMLMSCVKEAKTHRMPVHVPQKSH